MSAISTSESSKCMRLEKAHFGQHRLFGGRGGEHVEPAAFQGQLNQFSDAGIIFNNQNGFIPASGMRVMSTILCN
jgi:hypothetical protein